MEPGQDEAVAARPELDLDSASGVGPNVLGGPAPVPPDPLAERRRILGDALGVGVATGAYGLSFGAIAVAGGFSVVQACALSVFVFSGASQFAVVGVLAAGGAPGSAAATGLLLGTRNTLYGLRLASLLRLHGVGRVLGAQLVIDESTAMALKPRHPANARVGFFATGLAVFVLWNLATLIGALAGQSIGDPATYGLDAAVPAAFLALLWPRLTTMRSRLTSVLAAGLALLLVPATRPGVPIIAAGVIAVLAALRAAPVQVRR
jgi:4-azaleucine resistance transporter AzlC